MLLLLLPGVLQERFKRLLLCWHICGVGAGIGADERVTPCKTVENARAGTEVVAGPWGTKRGWNHRLLRITVEAAVAQHEEIPLPAGRAGRLGLITALALTLALAFAFTLASHQ